jgi:hypothetical protein
VTNEQPVALTRETFMTRFAVGEQVIIRYGRQQGHKAKIMESQPADVYKVKVADGSVRFFSGKGLAKEK